MTALGRRLGAACVTASLLVAPLTSAAAAAHERVVQTIVLIRHGIRAPTKSPEALAVYAAMPWPAWPVSPGQLTPHGAALMQSLGHWYAARFAAMGRVPTGCRSSAMLKVIADSTPRNRASGAALAEGLKSGCGLRFHALPANQDDPLFRGREAHDGDAADPAIASHAMPRARLVELQQVVLGCHDSACLAQARARGKQTLLDAKPAKALKIAGSLSENLMLAYVQGFAPAQVGWGRLDADGVSRLIELHNASFALAKKTPVAALARGGTMLAHITATLVAAAGGTPSTTPLASSDLGALIIVGHDTDLASQAGLLDLSWHNATQPDDYPPGAALIYQLLEDGGRYAVRLRIAQPTLQALRTGVVTAAGAMHVQDLRIPGCGDRTRCPLARFKALVADAVPARAVIDGAGNEPLVR